MTRARFRLLLVLSVLFAMVPITAAPAVAVTGDLVITGVVDGPLTGGIPKAIELYAVNNIADLSIYGVGSANNGGGTDGEEFTFPADSATAGDFIYLATETTAFTTFFGFAPDYTSTTAASINGDDAIELFMNGSVVDVFGDINLSGAGQPWDYLDGWAYRADGTGQDGTTFVLGNWNFSGINALDGETSNAGAAIPFPLGTYTTTASGPTILINEVDADTPGNDAAEFVELYDGGAGNTALDGLVVVFYNGSDDQSYDDAFDLDGYSTDADGYFVLGNPGVANVDLEFDPGSFGALQNGADAVALFRGDAADFPNDTAITTDDLIDAIVYDTSDGDDAGLLVLLNAGQPQVNENGRGAGATDSNQRCPNGSGGARNTSTYAQFAPTPGEVNLCEDPPTEVFIHDIQGSGDTSPLVGQTVAIEGIVVGDFQDTVGTNGDLNGFYVQEEDTDADGNPATSEGIFVFNGSSPTVDVAVGDLVRVVGPVSEFNGLTELSSFGDDVTVLSRGNGLPTAATPSLPVDDLSDFEPYEGMSVVFTQDLIISEYFNYDRFGEIVLSSERHLTPTAEFDPGSAAAIAATDLIARDRITLDDGLSAQNPQVTRHPNGEPFSLTNKFRGGDTLTGVVGALDYSFGLWRVQPTGPATYTNTNPRDASPDDVGGDVTVASFNVLNYFSTIDESGAECFPTMTRGDCRGADNADEFDRQRSKIIEAIAAIDADVVGLIEIENNVDDDAVIDLIAGLNEFLGGPVYDYVAAGITGTDAIKVAFIYKPASVSLNGAYAVLDDAAFLDPANTGEDRNRAALAQTFTENATGESFTAVINHFKSKSGSELDDTGAICVDGDPGNDIPDCDQGDGQAYFNYTRTLAAQVLTDWLATDPTGSGDPDVLVLGDLNSYDHEDPIYAMKDGGYTDLVFEFQGEAAYSYVFDGQTGYLDYGMANAALLPAVTGATVWHLNADEPDLLDYDTSFKSDGQDAIFDGTSPFRSSDHDPVIVGLNLANPMGDKEGVVAALEALLPTGDAKTDARLIKAIDYVDASLSSGWWTSDQSITDKKVFDNERQAIAQLALIVDGGGSEAEAAADAIAVLLNADRQLAQIELIAAIGRGGSASKIALAEAKLAAAETHIAGGQYAAAVNAYKAAWDAATKA